MRLLQSVDEVLDALQPVGERYRVTPQRISNWRARERIPSAYYLAMTEDLACKGFEANPAVWGMNGQKPNGHV